MGNVDIISFTENRNTLHNSSMLSFRYFRVLILYFFPDKLEGGNSKIKKSYFFTLLNGHLLNPVVYLNIK